MTTATILVLVLVGALIAYKIGSVALRVLGGFLVILGLVNIALPESTTDLPLLGEIAFVLVGIVLWLAGHWLFAFRHHAWRSTLAQRVFTMLPNRLDPTRNWGVRTVSGDRR